MAVIFRYPSGLNIRYTCGSSAVVATGFLGPESAFERNRFFGR